MIPKWGTSPKPYFIVLLLIRSRAVDAALALIRSRSSDTDDGGELDQIIFDVLRQLLRRAGDRLGAHLVQALLDLGSRNG